MIREALIMGILLTTSLGATESASCRLPVDLKLITTREEFAEVPTIATTSWDYLQGVQNPKGLTRLILIRHGESESNKNGCIAGRTDDSPLSEAGHQQAQEAGRLLAEAGVPISAVYSSPMQRAKNTALWVIPGAEINVDERLHEKFYGPIEGQSGDLYRPYILKEEIELAQLKSFCEKFAYKPHPDFESAEEVYGRVQPFMLDVHQKHQGQNVLVATHGGLMKAVFLLDAAKRGFETDYRSITLANAGVLVVEVEGEEIRVMAATRITYK